ncbi:hypothetical protein B0A48_14235 [Cryoendolithus antarcticus]|uniref:TFIIS N-terminal domain-containing protein n=1 Tax=Cryoendolithus antarcticus TaxID=1507870 RepID=A0A1V8SMC8_9PEZI|nr:hypothetical protein B0A48_14235 [Cryoendolithus antarcticus]
MEDLEQSTSAVPSLDVSPEPQANAEPNDPLDPSIEEENASTPPIANPSADMDLDEDEAPPSDNESELDDLDEAQFDNFDAANIIVPDAPVAVDESNVGLLGVHKRKRTEGEERESRKKKKEGRREKARKPKRVRAGEDGEDEPDFEGGPEMEGKRRRKGKADGGGERVRRIREPENEDDLPPEERRRRALDRKMDDALRTNKPARRRGMGIDLDAAADAELENMRQLMAAACQADQRAREEGKVATAKLKLLPQVTELLNRNTLRSSIIDPDVNILEAVRFYLEPADVDAALPNYQIQRELFAILMGLSMTKEALVASGLGKVIVFYTKSMQPQLGIKRQAEKLEAEWLRIVLGKRKDLRSKAVPTAPYDPLVASQRPTGSQHLDRATLMAEKRKKALAAPIATNRARVEGTVGSYSIMPASNMSSAVLADQGKRQGAVGEAAFRKVAARAKGKGGMGR